VRKIPWLCCIPFLVSVSYCHAEIIKIASIDWPPQLIQDQKERGYIGDIIEHIFKDGPYTLVIKTYPWSRAIALVKSGEVDALLAPAKVEAPELLYPVQEVGMQRMCFVTKSGSTFQYTGTDSLKGMRIGYAQDTSVSQELTAYMFQHSEQFHTMPYNGQYIDRSLGKLALGRLDAFLFTYNSTVYELQKLGKFGFYRMAGCDYSAKVFLAFTPQAKLHNKIKRLSNFFDQKMLQLKNSGKLQPIMDNYGLQDWQQYLKGIE